MSSNNSAVWKHFAKDPDNDKEATCNLCCKKIKRSGNTTNLEKHIRKKHGITIPGFGKKKRSKKIHTSDWSTTRTSKSVQSRSRSRKRHRPAALCSTSESDSDSSVVDEPDATRNCTDNITEIPSTSTQTRSNVPKRTQPKITVSFESQISYQRKN